MGIFNRILEFLGKTITVKDPDSYQRAIKRLNHQLANKEFRISEQCSISSQEEDVLSVTQHFTDLPHKIELADNNRQASVRYLDTIRTELSSCQEAGKQQEAEKKRLDGKEALFQSALQKIDFHDYQKDLHTIHALREKISSEKSSDSSESLAKIRCWETELAAAEEQAPDWIKKNDYNKSVKAELKDCIDQCNAFTRKICRFDSEAQIIEDACRSILDNSPTKQHQETEQKLSLFQNQPQLLQLWQDYLTRQHALQEKANAKMRFLQKERENVGRQKDILKNFTSSIEPALKESWEFNISLLKQHSDMLQKLIQEEQSIIQLYQTWKELLPAIEKKLDERKEECRQKADTERAVFQDLCSSFSDYTDRYINAKSWEHLVPLYREILEKHRTSYVKDLDLSSSGITEHLPFDKWVKKHNAQFMQSALKKYKTYFDQMFAYPLDSQQRTAVLSDEDYIQVVAGAGSGKTTTIQAKVKYLTEKQQVPPEKILLLAYNRSAKNEMAKRINKEMNIPVSVHTFHSFGLSVIKSTIGKKIVHDENREQVISTSVRDLILRRNQTSSTFAKKLLDFSILYQIEPKSMYDFPKMDTYYKMLGSIGFRPLRASLEGSKELKEEAALEHVEKQTMKGERVRSFEELVIANYLFLNGIAYEYEHVFPEKEWNSESSALYRPDFYLTKYDLYWEHFGINRDGRLPHLDAYAEQAYIESMNQKRQNYAALHRDLIETYSWQFSEGKIYFYLDKVLEEKHIEKNPIPADEIVQKLMENAKSRLFNQSTALIENYLNLYKSRLLKKEDLEQAKQWIACTSEFQRQRRDLFFEVFTEVYDEYEMLLEQENKLDFNDMIASALTQIQNKDYLVSFDYIIVDEYQDMSYSRHELLKALVLQKPDTKLFGVGDDWQAIYGFTGGDLNYFTDFQNYWPHALRLKIEQTHRNSQQLVDTAGDFVMKNPKQIKKELRSDLSCDSPILILQYTNDALQKQQFPASHNAVLQAVKWLKEQTPHGLKDEEILLLGRNNATVEEMKTLTRHKLQYNTVHRSKGSEAKAVILADVLDGITGFPNQMQDDPILQSLLAEPEQFRYAQERRLFYVALTRTKQFIVITTDEQKTSCFVNELMQYNHVVTQNITKSEIIAYSQAPVCKRCKGKMVIRKNRQNGSLFWGCSNYSQGCSYTQSYTQGYT